MLIRLVILAALVIALGNPAHPPAQPIIPPHPVHPCLACPPPPQ